jgi:hypothetical protein
MIRLTSTSHLSYVTLEHSPSSNISNQTSKSCLVWSPLFTSAATSSTITVDCACGGGTDPLRVGVTAPGTVSDVGVKAMFPCCWCPAAVDAVKDSLLLFSGCDIGSDGGCILLGGALRPPPPDVLAMAARDWSGTNGGAGTPLSPDEKAEEVVEDEACGRKSGPI